MKEVDYMLPMNGGDGDLSYANNSLFQRKILSMTWSITKEAITTLYCNTFPTVLSIADLGCSSGPNTFIIVSNLIKQVENIRRKLDKNSLEYQIYLNDLHGNDFNSIFRSLPRIQENLKNQIGNGLGPCFFSGVPGSFYGRLFPSQSLHFVHSSYSIHWLSQIPDGLEGNKGNIIISSTSPNEVLEAYHRQYERDFSMFLKCRAEELVTGGQMVLISTVRIDHERVTYYDWELLNLALHDMVREGVIEEEKVDSFNIQVYRPSLSEIEGLVQKEGSFNIDHLEVSRINWNFYETEFNPSNVIVDSGYHHAKCIRSVIEPLLVRHFGEAIIDELFYRFTNITNDYMLRKKIENINFTLSLTKMK